MRTPKLTTATFIRAVGCLWAIAFLAMPTRADAAVSSPVLEYGTVATAASALVGCSLSTSRTVLPQDPPTDPPQTPPGSECQTQGGEPRPCTVTEEWQVCLAAAKDAYEQCKERGTIPIIGWLMCRAAYNIDAWACHAEMRRKLQVQ